MIERRRGKRARVTLPARISLDGVTYDGMIGNVAEEGMFYNITTLVESDVDFSPHENIGIEVNIPHLGITRLKCEIRWFLKPSNGRKSLIMGMQVIDPSEEYRAWVRRQLTVDG